NSLRRADGLRLYAHVPPGEYARSDRQIARRRRGGSIPRIAQRRGPRGCEGPRGPLCPAPMTGRAVPSRTFTVSEANALIPLLEGILATIERKMARVHRAAERLHILDVLWGKKVLERGNPDHAEARRFREQITALMTEIEQI